MSVKILSLLLYPFLFLILYIYFFLPFNLIRKTVVRIFKEIAIRFLKINCGDFSNSLFSAFICILFFLWLYFFLFCYGSNYSDKYLVYLLFSYFKIKPFKAKPFTQYSFHMSQKFSLFSIII